MKKDTRKMIGAKVPDDYYYKVRDFAYDKRISISELIRRALDAYMYMEGENYGNVSFDK